jgi:hypothetical protein
VAPPLVGVAVNVTFAPAHDGFDPPVIATDTAGTSVVFTIMVMELEVAVAGLTHGAFEVMMHVTTCPFVNVELVYVGLLVPTLEPFTCH